MRQILLNSCARAATAAEARFRIDAPIAPTRGVRVFALDPAAVAVVARLQRLPWATAQFFAPAAPGWLYPIEDGASVAGPDHSGAGNGAGAGSAANGAGTPLDLTLDRVDVAVMVATTAAGAEHAAAVGAVCRARGIMTAGLALGPADPAGETVKEAVSILRPHARVILATEDEQDVSEVLTALRA